MTGKDRKQPCTVTKVAISHMCLWVLAMYLVQIKMDFQCNINTIFEDL